MANEKVHHNTKLGADLALGRKAISAESHAAVLAGKLGLQEAKDLGRGAGPSGPVVRVDKTDRSRECLCGCGNRTRGGRFVPGHDARMFRVARDHLLRGRELADEQGEYLEESGKMERVKKKLAEEEHQEQEAQESREAERQKKADAEKGGAK